MLKIRTNLDKPPDEPVKCRLCGQLFRPTYIWLEMFDRWGRGSCHDRCVDAWDKQRKALGTPEVRAPERFRELDFARLPDHNAARAAANFSPDSKYHTLAIIGARGMGKSRLMWKTVEAFFDDLGSGWPEYALFPEIMLDFDRALITRLRNARYVFIDDIGSTESYGRERAQLQDVIRARVQKNYWSFLCIDDPSFDPGFEDLFRDRAVVIYVR